MTDASVALVVEREVRTKLTRYAVGTEADGAAGPRISACRGGARRGRRRRAPRRPGGATWRRAVCRQEWARVPLQRVSADGARGRRRARGSHGGRYERGSRGPGGPSHRRAARIRARPRGRCGTGPARRYVCRGEVRRVGRRFAPLLRPQRALRAQMRPLSAFSCATGYCRAPSHPSAQRTGAPRTSARPPCARRAWPRPSTSWRWSARPATTAARHPLRRRAPQPSRKRGGRA
jgi:hypothetical protein